MAGNDSEKQLLTLIRDFASEKSQGERKLVSLKTQIEKLQLEVNAANAELEEAKRLKETTEQALKGYEVELAMSEASIQTLEARIASTQDHISSAGSDLDVLKSEEGDARDDFIKKMSQLNLQIREFQNFIIQTLREENCIGVGLKSNMEGPKDSIEDSEVTRKDLEDKLAQVISQMNSLDQESESEQHIQQQLELELHDLQRRVSLMESITNAILDLQELTRQTSELEETCTSLGDELQRRCICPNCHRDNSEELGGILQHFKRAFLYG